MNLDDFSTVVEDRRYIKPQVGLDESNAFIENLRGTQKANTQEIAQDTYNLGTAVPSNLGGLGGAGSYFTSRYQTPQTNDVIANLRSTAQAQALNEAINNKVAQAKERYNQAYRKYQTKARRAALNNTALSGGQNLFINTNGKTGDNSTTVSGEGSDFVKENTWAGAPYGGNIYRYRNGGFDWLYDSSNPYNSIQNSPLTAGKDGQTKMIGGKQYISMNGEWYPVVKSPF